MNDSLNLKLRAARKYRKIKQIDLAKKLNISASTLNGYMTGYRRPDLETLKKISLILDMPISFFLATSTSYNQVFEDLCTVKNCYCDKLSSLFRIDELLIEGHFIYLEKILDPEDELKIAEFFDVSVDYLLGREIGTSAFSPKDEKDISKKMDELMSQLENEKALMFDGEPLDDESKELLLSSLENSLRVAKALAKDKYTPKKYRK